MTDTGKMYDFFMHPLERRVLRGLRTRFIPQASGEVLEIGAGTGANIPFYAPKKIDRLVLTDLSEDEDLLRRRLRRNPAFRNRGGLFVAGGVDVEHLPFSAGSFDTVVAALVFCSVPDPDSGFREILRVLKPGGKLLFLEHILPRRPFPAAVFRGLTPAWRRIASGCHLDRKTPERMEAAGFLLEECRYGGKDIFVAGRALRP